MSGVKASVPRSKVWGTATEETPVSDDLAYGQIVIVAFRWILVVAGLIFTMWNPGPLGQLRIAILLILALAGVNFYLQAQLLRRRPTVEAVAYAASAGDLAVITLIVLAQGGFNSPTYIFYYPAILVFAVAFPTAVTYAYTLATVGAYALVGLSDALVGGSAQQVLITRVLTLVATGVCGNLYWRIERDRRRAAAEAREEMLEQMRRDQSGQKA